MLTGGKESHRGVGGCVVEGREEGRCHWCPESGSSFTIEALSHKNGGKVRTGAC